MLPVIAFPKTPAVCEPYEVVFPTEVTTPERFAFVVTVAALPVMLIAIGDEVETEATVFTPVAYRRPEAAASGLEVESPPNERVSPVRMTGHVAARFVFAEMSTDVSAELVMVGATEPTTVNAEHDTLPEQVAEEVATPNTPLAPLETRRLLEAG